MIVENKKSDQELQREVLAELDREVSINAADIGLMVGDGDEPLRVPFD